MAISDSVIKAAEMLGPLKNSLEKVEQELAEVTKKYEATEDEDEQNTLIETLEDLHNQKQELVPQVKTAETKLATLKKIEQDTASKSVPASKGPTPILGMKKDPGADYKPGDFLVKSMLVKGIAHLTQRPEQEVLQERYGDDENVRAAFGVMTKTAVPAATTTATGWASELVQTDVRGFLDMIRNVSVGAALYQRTLQLTFDGYGSITIPRINQIAGAGQTEPAWVGEGGRQICHAAA